MSTIPAWVRSHARTSPERVAIEDLTFERTLGYAELSDRIDRLAGHLFRVGVERGDRVAVLARNSHHVLEVGSRVTAETVTLTILPFCHVAGLNLFTNPTLFAAGHVVLFREYDPKRTLGLLTRSEARVTHVTGVPAVFQFMQGLPEWGAHRFDGLLGMVGGSPIRARS